jgi:tetratricopeptide (TPR) repeat protein
MFDGGQHAEARHLYQEAFLLARLARDPVLETHAFSSMSHQATTLGQTQLGLACAHASQEIARGKMPPRVESLLALREARAWAAAGDRAEFEGAYRRAAVAFERGPRDDDPHWIKFLDEGDFSGYIGRCYADLQQEALAERLFRESFQDLWTSSNQRNRAAWSLRLAILLARQRRLDEAFEVGSQVLDVLVSLGSRRILQQVRELQFHLEQSRNVPVASKLCEHIDAVLGNAFTGRT